MPVSNFNEKISLYQKSNPNLSNDDIGVLLLIDSLYKTIPDDVAQFRKLYSHLDPRLMDNNAEGIMFLQIAKSDEPTSVIKHRLNSYINIKLNYLRKKESYENNMTKFKALSCTMSDIIIRILGTAKFPSAITSALMESKEIEGCHDFLEMLELFRKTQSKRIKYEILRKIGLIVMQTRINKTFFIDDIDHAIEEVRYVFSHGLGLERQKNRFSYLWIDENNHAVYSQDKRSAFASYQGVVQRRSRLALPIHSLQIIEYTPYKTKFNSEILHFEMRNKMRRDSEVTSASFIEKIVRKNLEFPNQVHDVIGIKLVVPTEDQIPQLVKDISSFLGGNSTRKKEKNALNRFGKRELGKYSSKDYFVWKAVYDISLPSPNIRHVKSLLKFTKGNKEAQKALREKIKHFSNRPQDFVVEVQLQDFNSYLLSIANGSPTDHNVLKMNQIRQNSFYKLFPKEIYEQELIALRNKILQA